MAKRTLSEEQKRKMQEGRKRKAQEKAKQNEPPVTDEIKDVEEQKRVSPPLEAPQEVSQEDLLRLVVNMQNEINTLKAQNPQVTEATPEQKLEELEKINPNQARISQNGVQGIVFRYPVEESYYPDPSDRLINEPKLARFAMGENYIFRWSVEGETYEKNGVTFAEPRFTLELFRKLYTDEGEPMRNPKNGKPVMALVARQMQHEDEMTTKVAAQRLGILDKFGNDDEGFRKLMDEIRYHRIREWLFGIFTPPKVQTFKNQSRTQVIDGKVVEVFDSEELTDHEKAQSQTSSIQSETGVGSYKTPQN